MATGIAYGWQVENSNGTPVSGALISFKKSGTSTDATTYTDKTLTVPASNPVVADAAGWFNTYLDPNQDYDITIKSADGSTTYSSPSVLPTSTGSQPLDATLTGIAALVPAADEFIQATGTDTFRAIKLFVDTYAAASALTGSTSGDIIWIRGRNSATGAGGGMFKWSTSDLSTEVTADPRSGVYLPPDSDNTGASGAWVRVGLEEEPWKLEASWFKLAADTSDSAAVQAAVDLALDLNRSADIHVRQWQFATTVTIDLSARTQDAVEQGLPVINFKGDGDGISWIELTAATCALEYLGGTGAGGHSFIDWEGFSIRPDLSTVSARASGTVGIRLNNCAYWNFSDIEFAYLALGLDGIDILSGNGHQCFFRLNAQHMYVRGGTYEGEANYSHPNAIGWADTLFAGSTKVSVVKGCANFLLQGGTVEGNGSSYTAGGLTATMNGATQANPCVITTTAAHGISAGDYIRISGVAGMTELNDLVFVATSVTSTTITLEGTDGTAIDATGYTAYSSGGTITQLGGAFLFSDCGVQGGVALKADGVYVEGHSGLADFIIDHTTSERAQYVFIGNTFQRYSSTAYTKYHLSFASSIAESRMVLLGNAFESISPYTDDGGRPYWEAGVAEVYEFGNLIQDPALMPQNTLTPDSAAAVYTASELSGIDAGRWGGSEVRISDGTLDGNAARAYSDGSTWINVAEKIYRFRVSWSGSAYSATLPSGWSLTTNGNNTCTITHGLGSTEYVVMAMVGGTTAARLVESAHTTTQTQIALYNTSNTLVGDHFNFELSVT